MLKIQTIWQLAGADGWSQGREIFGTRPKKGIMKGAVDGVGQIYRLKDLLDLTCGGQTNATRQYDLETHSGGNLYKTGFMKGAVGLAGLSDLLDGEGDVKQMQPV